MAPNVKTHSEQGHIENSCWQIGFLFVLITR